MGDDLNDSLDGLFGGPSSDSKKTPKTPPESFVPAIERLFTEACKKCGGSGNWRPGYPCYTCKGSGKLAFKTAPEARAKSRVYAKASAERKADDAAKALAEYQAEHKAEFEWLNATAERNARRGGTFAFPAAMIEAAAKYGSLTENQMAAVHKLMAKEAARDSERQAREADKPSVDVSKLESAFDIAKAKAKGEGAMGVKRLHLRLQSGEHSLSFSPGTPGSQWDGMIFVREAGKDGDKLGFVKQGKFTRRFHCSDAQEAAILDACNDPLKAALAYGQKWSQCAVCGRELTNGVSIERGIGPICAEKYGW